MSVLQCEPVIAQEDEQLAVQNVEKALRKYNLGKEGPCVQGTTDVLPRLITPYGDEVELPSFLFQLLQEITYGSARGNAIGIVLLPKTLAILEAAEFLDAPISYVTNLLDSGELPSVQTDAGRRIPLSALMEFERKAHEGRLEAIREIAQMCEEDGIYD